MSQKVVSLYHKKKEQTTNNNKKQKAMIHLERQNAAYTTLACVKDGFIKGRVVSLEKFNEVSESGEFNCCKKCKKIAEKWNKKLNK